MNSIKIFKIYNSIYENDDKIIRALAGCEEAESSIHT